MTPKEILSEELAGLAVMLPLMTSEIDFWHRWYNESMIVIRIFKAREDSIRGHLVGQFSYKIVTMEDVDAFRKVFIEKMRRYSKDD